MSQPMACHVLPCLQRPLDLGADIVMHSLTKYMNGHSDAVMGAAITDDDNIAEYDFLWSVRVHALKPQSDDQGMIVHMLTKLWRHY